MSDKTKVELHEKQRTKKN